MTLSCVTQGPLGILRLERPERANAYTRAMLRDLEAHLERLLAMTEVTVLVLESAGERAFCAGADLSELGAAASEDALDLLSQRVFDRIARAPKISVVAIQGAAIAGGFELALACDLRVASSEARFHLPETSLGILPSAGGSTRLTRIVGPARAKAVILGGREIDAPTALAWGLVDRVAVDPRAEARQWATQVARRDPMALRLAKSVIDHDDPAASLAAERLAEAFLYARRKGG